MEPAAMDLLENPYLRTSKDPYRDGVPLTFSPTAIRSQVSLRIRISCPCQYRFFPLTVPPQTIRRCLPHRSPFHVRSVLQSGIRSPASRDQWVLGRAVKGLKITAGCTKCHPLHLILPSYHHSCHLRKNLSDPATPTRTKSPLPSYNRF